MIERTTRPMTAEERARLEGWRDDEARRPNFVPRVASIAGAVAFVVGIALAIALGGGERGANALYAPLVPAVIVGAAFDFARMRRKWRARKAVADVRWRPALEGAIESVAASASAALRLDDSADTAWLLQVEPDRVLCVWDWCKEAKENVEFGLVPRDGEPTALSMVWSGAKLKPIAPRRRFGRGDRRPGSGELLAGRLEDVALLLRSKRAPPKRAPTAAKMAKLADAVEALGFYALVAPEEKDGVKGEIAGGLEDWLEAACRTFDADAERLAEGGVGDLLDDLRSALRICGVELGAIAQSYDEKTGYAMTVGGERVVLWGEGEGARAWDLAVTRTAAFVNARLAAAGSDERLHLFRGGEDGVFALVSPRALEAIAKSGVFRPGDLPLPLA